MQSVTDKTLMIPLALEGCHSLLSPWIALML